MAFDMEYAALPLTALTGIGRVKAEYFAKLGINCIEDLLYHFPRGYQNRGQICRLGEASMLSCHCATILTVGSAPVSVRLKGNKIMTRFTAFDDSGKCVITFFNQPYIKDIFYIGDAFRFWGRVEKVGMNYTMSCPEYEPYNTNIRLPDFKSVYPLTEGLNQKSIASAVTTALADAKKIPDPIPDDIRALHNLPPIEEALRAIHFPGSYQELETARRRFIFEELFLFSLGMGKSSRKKELSEQERLRPVDIPRFLACLPFSLTGAQMRTLEDIKKDMTGKQPMTRLICGDVGSGKTVCAEGAIYIALENGRQAALMVPTEILARQHFSDLSPFFERLGYNTVLLVGSLPASAKKKAREHIFSGKANLVIGTQALLTDDTVFKNPALVIVDEQHRFGVNQRSVLTSKGEELHTLVMTATPIPRTLALILYNGLDISYIDELPPGRRKVLTYMVNEGYRTRLNHFIQKQADEGHQTYVVCPAVEQEEDSENGRLLPFDYDPLRPVPAPIPLKSAVQFSEELQKNLPSLRVAFIHGKMKPKEKDAVMDAFSKNEIQVLVSTTVIEVGINIPNATLMIIENAERFGLSQLHQLRGRVGRGNAQSYCVLVSDCKEDSTAYKRLSTICKSQKGLEIAEEDLRLRGPGDFFPSAKGTATRQSGDFTFRLSSSCTEVALPEKAMISAKILLENDPELTLEKHKPTLLRMQKLFTVTEHTMN